MSKCVSIVFFSLYLFIWRILLFIKKKFLFDCTRSQLQHTESLILAVAWKLFSYSMWTLSCHMWAPVPWPGVESGLPALGAQSLSHWTTREIPPATLYHTHLFPGTPSSPLPKHIEVIPKKLCVPLSVSMLHPDSLNPKELHPSLSAPCFVFIHITPRYYKGLAHMIMEAGQSKIYSVGQQTGDPEELLVWMKS